jgi:hypothetical protein
MHCIVIYCIALHHITTSPSITSHRVASLRIALHHFASLNIAQLLKITSSPTTTQQAFKSEEGERYRKREVEQLLLAIDRGRESATACFDGVAPAVIITGDLNASPVPCEAVGSYASTVYPLIKAHPLRYRSVLNDDLALHLAETRGTGSYTGHHEPVQREIEEVAPALCVIHCSQFRCPQHSAVVDFPSYCFCYAIVSQPL